MWSDFKAEVAVITGDVPMGGGGPRPPATRLLMLFNEVSLRHLIPAALAKGFGFLQSKPATSFSPVAVSPDELGDAWIGGGKVHLPLCSTWNGKLVGQPHAGADIVFNFPQLIVHLCKSRNERAGTIFGSGTVSNKDAGRGYSSIFEKRCPETIADGVSSTPFMLFGDTIRIEMLDVAGKSIFSAIAQTVKQARRAAFDKWRWQTLQEFYPERLNNLR